MLAAIGSLRLRRVMFLLLTGLSISDGRWGSGGQRDRGGGGGSPYGRLVGQFREYAHGIQGTVYAVDENSLFVEGFSYDGSAPDAFFWVGNTDRPNPNGLIVPYPQEYNTRDPPVLRYHNKANIVLKLPAGKRVKDIKWLSVWCRRFTVNFGEVFIPEDLEPPRRRVLPEFKRLAHGLRSGNITILDAKTFYIPNLHYDGAGPDAYFWVGNGSEPTSFGVKVPNEVGSLEPLRGYQGEDIEIQLPRNMTVYDIDWLAVWCVQYRHNFGHVYIPHDLDVPPALGQTKITPPWWYSPTSSTTASSGGGSWNETELSNCRELIPDRVQVQWEVQGDSLLVRVAARMGDSHYVAFGLSGDENRASMLGADVVISFLDRDAGAFRAVDYYLSATAQCDGANGVCPDERIGGRDDVELVAGERRNGVTVVTYRRPLQTNEPINDRPVPLDREVVVIAAIGPLNARLEANAHEAEDKTTDDIRINFGSQNDQTCTSSLFNQPEETPVEAWPPMKIIDETVFTARIGPTGGKRGYTPITGHPSWGIAWYINDKIIPELYVIRGKTYTFIIEGGNDPSNPARYHPFYISDSAEGGFGQKKESEQREQRVFAGVSSDSEGYPAPIAAGRYCEWTHKTIDRSMQTPTFEEFFETLRLECEEGEPATLNWTVAPETPSLVYYQCYTHNNLGWKIHVLDSEEELRLVKAGSISKGGASITYASTLLLTVALSFILHSICNFVSVTR
nr:PREDICTED: protein Skeletor, isoforms B/C-like [Bemisia tabaci]